jgi:hypothetical protein
MSYPIAGLFNGVFHSFFLILGFGTAVNKLGIFFKVLEDEKEDNFKKGFDKISSDLVNDFNNSFVSFNLISSNVSKIAVLSYELMIGEKYIKKTKDGKIVVQDKTITFNNYEEKIGKLNEKVKNYKGLLKNMKENNKISFDLSDIDEEDEDEDENEEENKEEIEEINVDE